MVKIESFAAQQWVNAKSRFSKYDLSTSCAAPISIEELSSISEDKSEGNGPLPTSLFSTPLGYGESYPSSNQLRTTLANLYSIKSSTPLTSDNVLITQGASLANLLVFHSLCGPGDDIIVQYPTYQPLYSLPESIGVEVTLWESKEQDKWQLDLEELKGLIKPNTKMIVLTNPANPTGAVILRSQLQAIIEIAREHCLIVFSDEIYRPLFHSITPMDKEFPPSVLSLGYDNVLVSASLSKCYSLPAIRVGWLASRNSDYIASCRHYRTYSTISVSPLDEAVAAFALDGKCLHTLLKRNMDLAKHNIAALEAFVEQYRWACAWIRPVAGTIAFVKFFKMGKPVDDVEFCRQLQDKKGVLLLPGSYAFGNGEHFKGYVRIGYAMDPETLEAGLSALREFMEEEFENVPLAGEKLPLR
ncbi:PLP-dependent aminotransferase family protein [Emydomyces testavorans]|uniref:PLP-dependent aminotransferase family protein n=1 Tax=Emydomyces testavorans TaxID=2070801 RepID=A0AAF0DJ54_9EURO|nr:PLP-dependent aminotransferase family protein [Emydomyces testavorans]